MAVPKVPEALRDSTGLTGLAVSEEYVFAVGNPGSLFVFARGDLSLLNHHEFERGHDVHSLWNDGEKLWAVSTGTEEVLELALDGARVVSESVAWRPEPDGPRQDIHHLNAIGRFDGRVVVSGFGKRAGELWSSATNGFVHDIERDDRLVEGIEQPHSFTTLDGSLLVCESRGKRVRSTDGAASPRLGGYTRGLCVLDGTLLVGTSMGRRVSKATSHVGNPSDRGESAGECAIVLLSAETWEVQGTVDAASLGREIYDLLPIEGVEDWPLVPDTEWHEEALRGLWKSVDESAALATTSQGKLGEERRRTAGANRRAAEAKREAQEVKERLEARQETIVRLEQELESTQAALAAREEQLARATRRPSRLSLRARMKLLRRLARPSIGHLRMLKAYMILRRSGAFDPDFYLASNPHVGEMREDPLMHYVEHGWREGLDPSPWFSSSDYLARRRHVAEAGVNPLLHHVVHGAADEARSGATRPAGPGPSGDESGPARAEPGRAPTPRGSRSTPVERRPSGPKVSVLCWDMGHNPLGRAYLLAEALSRSFDVEIVGAQFPRYGTKVWAPLRGGQIPMRTFAGKVFPDHYALMERMARELSGDVVLVSKPRLPSYELGILAKEAVARPLILDVDDRELSFFPGSTGISLTEVDAQRDDPDFRLPFGRAWTSYCDTIIEAADRVTVSNEQLAGVYGGTIAPHARDEQRFDPSLYSRTDARARFGLDDEDRVILFVGTPRPHKGVLELVDALEAIRDARYKLVVIGSVHDRGLKKRMARLAKNRVVLLEDRPLSELPENLTIGDLVCLLQDPESEIARYQMPAKFTDALAMGVPMLGTSVPPLNELISQGLIERVETGALAEQIVDHFDHLDERRARALVNRRRFLDDYSYEALNRKLAGLIEEVGQEPVPFPHQFDELLAYHRSRLRPSGGRLRSRSRRKQGGIRSPAGTERTSSGSNVSRVAARGRSTRGSDDLIDVVFFWKQNDSGIYGRRSDMMVKYLAESPRVGQVVHFDAPMDIRRLYAHRRRAGDRTDHGRLIVDNTMRRARPGQRPGKVKEHVFLYRRPWSLERPRWRRLVRRRSLPPRERYVDWVADLLDGYRVGERTTVFWTCPIDYDLPQLSRVLKPDLVVADVIDDHREFLPPNDPERARATQNYRDVLGASDLVITNCRPLQERMAEYAEAIHLVPNASEPFSDPGEYPVPDELRSLPRPVLGYVGNLSSRIDIELLEHVALARPEWQLVLLGSTHMSRSVLRLRRHGNVHFLGVRPYHEVRKYISAFDVAMVPHADTPLTQSMNPLKVFVYASLGVPIVSTTVANIEELRPLVRVSSTASDFVENIEQALRQPRGLTPEGRELLDQHTWPRRVDLVLELLDDKLNQDGPAATSRPVGIG